MFILYCYVHLIIFRRRVKTKTLTNYSYTYRMQMACPYSNNLNKYTRINVLKLKYSRLANGLCT